MKANNYLFFALFLSFLLISASTLCQQAQTPSMFGMQPEDTLYVSITTIEKNEWTGRLLLETPEYIEIENEYDIILRIPKLRILAYKTLISNPETPEGFFQNPHATRYFYGPNGYGLRKGEGYYQNLWVMFNQISYGFSDYLTVGAGLVPLFLIEGSPSPIWVTPKFSIPVKKDHLNIGAGGLLATVAGEPETSFGIAYGTITHGSRDSNATLGLGWAYTNEGFAKKPTLTFSAMHRVGEKGYFMTENYLISTEGESFGLILIGGRSVQKKLAVDYGLLAPVNLGVFIAFPWLSITLPFGNTY